jgi:hypothetical protein
MAKDPRVGKLAEMGMATPLIPVLLKIIDDAASGAVAEVNATEVAVDLEDFTATDVSGALQELYDAINA